MKVLESWPAEVEFISLWVLEDQASSVPYSSFFSLFLLLPLFWRRAQNEKKCKLPVFWWEKFYWVWSIWLLLSGRLITGVGGRGMIVRWKHLSCLAAFTLKCVLIFWHITAWKFRSLKRIFKIRIIQLESADKSYYHHYWPLTDCLKNSRWSRLIISCQSKGCGKTCSDWNSCCAWKKISLVFNFINLTIMLLFFFLVYQTLLIAPPIQ